MFIILAVTAGALIAKTRIPEYLGEDIAMYRHPSAALASSYADRHFNAMHPEDYDIDRAQMWYQRAAALDPSTPHINHQLARIHFLSGDLHAALALINLQIAAEGESLPNSYYMRGLIEGYMGKFDESAADYEHFLRLYPHNWAARNDAAWVLLKAERYDQALTMIDGGLADFPDNPWLLNSKAIALYELGRYADASVAAGHAAETVQSVTRSMWLTAYPGNDPLIADEGIETLKRSIADNVHRIEAHLMNSGIK